MYLALTDNRRFSKFISAVIVSLFITNISAGLSGITGIRGTVISSLCKGFLGIYLLSLIPNFIYFFNKKMLAILFCSIFVSIVNLLFFQAQTDFFIHTLIYYFTICLPVFMAAVALEEFSYLKLCLLASSYIVSAFSLLFLICIFSGKLSNFNEDTYSMGLGYAMLIPYLTILENVIDDRKRRFAGIACLTVMTVVITAYGSRGPLLSIILFIGYYLIRHFYKNRQYGQIIAVIFGGGWLCVGYKRLLGWFAEILDGFEIQSRTIRLLLRQGVYLSHREDLYDVLLNEMAQHPFYIRGINAEWPVIGVYAHNIFLELYYQFGIILGSIALIGLFYLIISQIIGSDNDYKRISLLLMFACIPPLFLSNSLWTDYKFWLWLGISLAPSARTYIRATE